MKVTIAINKDMAAWLRAEADRAGLSVSDWIGVQLAKLRADAASIETDLLAVMATPWIPMSDVGGSIYTRNDLYDRPGLSRFR